MTADWRRRGACRDAPDLWFLGSFRTPAVHICRAHCPVVKDCYEWAKTASVVDGVAGGQAYGIDGVVLGRSGTGEDVARCGPSCLPYRQHFRDRQEE